MHQSYVFVFTLIRTKLFLQGQTSKLGTFGSFQRGDFKLQCVDYIYYYIHLIK